MLKKVLRYSYIAIIVCFMVLENLSVVLAADEEVLSITLKNAIIMAIKASEDVQTKDNEIARSNSQMRGEKSELFPHVSTSASWSQNYEYPDISATALANEYDFNAGITLEQKLFTFGRISSSILATREKIKVNQWNKKASEQEIIYITKFAYYNVYLKKQTLKIAQASYERAQKNKDILEQRSARGRASKYDNIKIAADIASRSPSINSARASLNSAVQTLKRIIGVNLKKDIDITDNLAKDYHALNIEQLTDGLNDNQPVLKALEQSIAATEFTIREKKAEYFPEISAFSTWNRKGSSAEPDLQREDSFDYGVVGLKINLPIWSGGKRKEDLKQARIDKKNKELSLEKTSRDLSLKLDIAVGEYNEFIKTLTANEEAVRLAEETFKLSQDLFRSGQISITDLNDAELLLSRGKLSKENTLFNINATLAQIEKLAVTEVASE